MKLNVILANHGQKSIGYLQLIITLVINQIISVHRSTCLETVHDSFTSCS